MEMALKVVSCAPECGFMVRDHDEKELIDMVKMHVSKTHSKTVSDDEVRGMMKTV